MMLVRSRGRPWETTKSSASARKVIASFQSLGKRSWSSLQGAAREGDGVVGSEGDSEDSRCGVPGLAGRRGAPISDQWRGASTVRYEV